jgi:hypothetical protein
MSKAAEFSAADPGTPVFSRPPRAPAWSSAAFRNARRTVSNVAAGALTHRDSGVNALPPGSAPRRRGALLQLVVRSWAPPHRRHR